MNFDKDFFDIAKKAASESEAVLNYANDAAACKNYCAQAEIYRRYLINRREEAGLLMKNFREVNDKIFSMSMQILEMAIDSANAELAKASLELLETMRKTKPDFYKAYYKHLLG